MTKTVRVMACLVCVFVGNAMGGVLTTFDSGLDGWTSNTPAEVTWADSGGNPGGYARFEDATINDTYLIAPPRYLGDWSGLDGVESISYDHNVIWITGSAFPRAPYTVVISGPGGQATWTGAYAPRQPGWNTVTAPVTESEWTIDSGQWDAILANVTDLSIRVEQYSNLDISGMDNISLHTPEPATLSVLGLGGLAMLRRRRRR